MHQLIDTINLTEYKGIKASKLLDINASEIIKITLEAGSVFTKHVSKVDATLIVLEGRITYNVNEQGFELKQHQVFNFPKDEEHWIEALENSKFLIIR